MCVCGGGGGARIQLRNMILLFFVFVADKC